jgi:hypothetical protein
MGSRFVSDLSLDANMVLLFLKTQNLAKKIPRQAYTFV